MRFVAANTRSWRTRAGKEDDDDGLLGAGKRNVDD